METEINRDRRRPAGRHLRLVPPSAIRDRRRAEAMLVHRFAAVRRILAETTL